MELTAEEKVIFTESVLLRSRVVSVYLS